MKFHTEMAQFILAGTIVIGYGQALADGDALKGEQVFKKCIACHSVKEAKNKVGPHLIGIVGRPIASVPDFKYSDAMKAYATAAMSWDEENLNTYFENPRAVVAKTKMAFTGLKKEDERADLIAYLKTIP
jgi:cytochrome c